MEFHVISLFPEVIETYCSMGIVGRAFRQGIAHLYNHDLRQYGIGKHRKVDDRPFGGGTGLILRPEPIFEAHSQIKKTDRSATIILTPAGQKLTQTMLRTELTQHDQLILICGRYEGIDHRVSTLADYQISIGDYVLSGGELGALVIIDGMVRLLPDTFTKGTLVTDLDSFGEGQSHREAPQYTHPRSFCGMGVPDVLLSGNHASIAQWRQEYWDDCPVENKHPKE